MTLYYYEYSIIYKANQDENIVSILLVKRLYILSHYILTLVHKNLTQD